MNVLKNVDCMVVIGQAMISIHSKKIIASMLEREVPVIEFNPVSVINRGNNLQVKGPMEQNVKEMFSLYQNMWKLLN